jgi:hypothetical protein
MPETAILRANAANISCGYGRDWSDGPTIARTRQDMGISNRLLCEAPFHIGAGSSFVFLSVRRRNDEFLEAWIISQRIEHWIESKQRRREWSVANRQRTLIRYRE